MCSSSYFLSKFQNAALNHEYIYPCITAPEEILYTCFKLDIGRAEWTLHELANQICCFHNFLVMPLMENVISSYLTKREIHCILFNGIQDKRVFVSVTVGLPGLGSCFICRFLVKHVLQLFLHFLSSMCMPVTIFHCFLLPFLAPYHGDTFAAILLRYSDKLG